MTDIPTTTTLNLSLKVFHKDATNSDTALSADLGCVIVPVSADNNLASVAFELVVARVEDHQGQDESDDTKKREEQ